METDSLQVTLTGTAAVVSNVMLADARQALDACAVRVAIEPTEAKGESSEGRR
jgi:hypothetical protein